MEVASLVSKCAQVYKQIRTQDPISVGNMLTLNGVTRALVGQESGRYGANHIEDKTGKH